MSNGSASSITVPPACQTRQDRAPGRVSERRKSRVQQLDVFHNHMVIHKTASEARTVRQVKSVSPYRFTRLNWLTRRVCQNVNPA